MFDTKKIEELEARINQLMTTIPLADLEKNIRALLASFFSKLDLVSREEYEIQSQMLQHTLEKLKILEERLSQLENQHKNDIERGE